MDRFSLLHFAVGIMMYFWGFSFWSTLFLNILFEWLENTPLGMYVINHYITAWTGDKGRPDTIINRVGDVFFAMAGWYLGRLFDVGI